MDKVSPSPEAIRANEALLEKLLLLDTSRPHDPSAVMLSGHVASNPSGHPDPRMSWTLKDMVRFYDPPYVKKEIPPLVIK